MSRRAVVLLSGGLDSSTVLAVASSQGFEPYALTIRYGQRHSVEIDAARRVAKAIGVVQHVVVDIDLRTFGGSSLTAEMPVPKSGNAVAKRGIPNTYVPARNTIFLSLALAWAEVLRATDIFIGVNAVDYSGYPDCRPEFVQAFERTANLATKAGSEGLSLRIHAPLIDWTKAEIIAKGIELGVDYSLTSSCYDPLGDQPCGACDSCRIRRQGFDAAGINDPLTYAGA